MQNPILIIGPPGCGKTLNKEKLARIFNCEHIKDEIFSRVIYEPNTLYLTRELPDNLPRNVKIITFADAMEEYLTNETKHL